MLTLYEKKVVPKFEEIKQWRKSGQTEENISKLLGISYASFCNYKEKHPEFNELLSNAKEVLIKELEHTMFQMALGKIKVTDVKKYISQSGDKENVRLEETVKELPPSVPLLIFSLKNLASNRWRDRPEVSADGTLNVAVENISAVSDQLKKAIKDDIGE